MHEVNLGFCAGLFGDDIRDFYTARYANSRPYKHAIINDLLDDTFLRSVLNEINANISFKVNNANICKIYQAVFPNLNGLHDKLPASLPSLLRLRNAIYSETFCNYVSHITNCGLLSSHKVDMVITMYTPGCFFLCQNDVIGTRRLRYILYLADPDKPWKPHWGGSLRLFPKQDTNGEVALPDLTRVIPPTWNRLSVFAVPPGESFYDVEEVYDTVSKEQLENDGGRVYIAISGWFHAPQVGDENYVQSNKELHTEGNSGMRAPARPPRSCMPASQNDLDNIDAD